MGNTIANLWKGISDAYLYEAEQQMLKVCSNLNEPNYQILNVDINEQLFQMSATTERIKRLFELGNPENFIHTVHFFNPNETSDKPRILMIHGFGCTGTVFAKIVKYLKEYFRITAIDLLGQGGSGRPDFALTDAKDCTDFFVLSVEAWMRASKYREAGDFMLFGHSLGGYVSSNFILDFPESITKLFMVSAVGISTKPEGYSADTIIQKQTNFLRKMMFTIVRWLWQQNLGVFTSFRRLGYLFSIWFLGNYV